MTEDLRVLNVVLCDQVRREDNGKLILIGVYARDIQVTEVPANIMLWLAIQCDIARPIDATMEFRCLADDSVIDNQTGRLHTREAGIIFASVPNIPILNITKSVRLDFQWKVGPSDWKSIYSIPLITPRASVPSQPS